MMFKLHFLDVKKKASGILLYTDTHYAGDTFKLSIHILHWDLYNVWFFLLYMDIRNIQQAQDCHVRNKSLDS